MTKPRLVDLCCKAGGATAGYQRAGFYVVGVDIEPQPNYCGDEFIQADALEFLRSHAWMLDFDAAHASPPCPRYMRGGLSDRERHPDLLPPIRGLLARGPIPWVIENVPGAPMRADVVLCGSQFDLEIRRHRWFEFSSPPPLVLLPPCDHTRPVAGVYGHPHGDKGAWPGMLPGDLATWSRAMGIDWMTAAELADAIPPAYTEFIGGRLLEQMEVAA